MVSHTNKSLTSTITLKLLWTLFVPTIRMYMTHTRKSFGRAKDRLN